MKLNNEQQQPTFKSFKSITNITAGLAMLVSAGHMTQDQVNNLTPDEAEIVLTGWSPAGSDSDRKTRDGDTSKPAPAPKPKKEKPDK